MTKIKTKTLPDLTLIVDEKLISEFFFLLTHLE